MTFNLLFLVAIGIGFYTAFNIGANDVANSMGTSVASRALTLKQAIFIAGIFNFLGALLAGSYVTETVRKGIINPAYFVGNENSLIIGMIAVLAGAGVWVTVATYLKMPVSTTHSIIGALVGFGLIEVGIRGIQWKIVLTIILTWITSPLIGALISYLLFTFIQRKILNTLSPLKEAKKIVPFLLVIVIFILSMFFIFGGSKRFLYHFHFIYILGISAGIAFIAGLRSYFFLQKNYLRKNREYEKTENLFKPLQILSACYESFAHGSNDVANAAGPIAAIVMIMDTQKITSQVPIPLWILIFVGIGLVTGISTWGYRVMETIGKKITEITPTRGFAAEFGAATVILFCSRLGIPVSTTHASVGTVVGVGLAHGLGAIDLRVIRNIILSWLITLPAAAGFTIVIYKLITIFI